jgi:2-aminoadipate transaminase
MDWTTIFAERTGLMKRSTVRELLKLTARQGMISFAGGLPAPELFPLDAVRAASEKVLSTKGAACLQYGESEGVAELRDYVASTYSRPGYKISRQNVAIVNGSQQALDLIGRVLLNKNDWVLVESPTYLALLSAWRPCGVRFQGVPSDADGMQTEALPQYMTPRPKVIYAIPNFQNPQGTTLSLERRQWLAGFLRQTNQVLVEDNPYGELRYEGESLPHLFELNAQMDGSSLNTQVIHTGTFSKVLAPGLRLGFVIAEEPVIDKIVQAKQSTDLHTSTFLQHLLLELLRQGLLETQIPLLRKHYGERRDAMLLAMDREFPSWAQWTRPSGGFFLLVTLTGGIRAADVFSRAIQSEVAFVPGDDFHLDGAGANTFRLNFSLNSPAVIDEGIRRLGLVLKSL